MAYKINLKNLEKYVEAAAKVGTKRAISANCNISRATLDKILKGGNTSLYTFLDIVNYIGASIDDIIVNDSRVFGIKGIQPIESEISTESHLRSRIEDLENLVKDKERIIRLYENMSIPAQNSRQEEK